MVRKPQPRLAWLTVCLAIFSCSFGCTPSMLNMLISPFVDDRIPPKCKLADKEKEVTVAIATNFAHPVTRTDLLPADLEMSEALTRSLQKRFKENKEKVKIIPPHQVRSYQNKHSLKDVVSSADIGKHFKADYVINLEIQHMDLYTEKSYNMLFRGNAEINLTVWALNEDNDEKTVYEEIYRIEYPKEGPKEASGSSPSMFRGLFLNHIGNELARRFTPYPREEMRD